MTAPNPTLDPDAGYTAIINYYLGQWGLSSLAPVVTSLGQTGASSDQINLTLQQTPEWQARFAGNAGRIAAGLAPLDPASYLALEDQYTQTARAYNLPAGFVDKELMDSWIAGDVSASEASDRIKTADDIVSNDATNTAWKQYYGQGDVVAAVLDPSRAQSVIDRQAQVAQIGGAAIGQGLNASLATATQAQQQGVTLAQARQAYQDIATRLPTDNQISNRFGQQFGQQQEEQATLLGQADQLRQQNNIYSEEQSLFKGHGGASDTSGNPGSNY